MQATYRLDTMNNGYRFKTLVDNAKNIVITTHLNPDADGIGSAIALYLALKALKKDVFCVIEEELPSKLKNIDKNSIIISHETFKNLHPNKIPDLMIVVDAHNPQRVGLGVQSLLMRAKDFIFVDHHPCSPTIKAIHCIDVMTSATGELVASLILCLGVEITKEMAACLYISILVDTSSFRYPTVSGDTHRILGQLLDAGIEPANAYNDFYGTKGLQHLKILGEVLSSAHYDQDKQLAWIVVKKSQLDRLGVNQDDTYSFINYLLVLDGIKVACMFLELDNAIKVSLRSSGDVDVGGMAQALGGGGHNHSAATVLDGDFDQLLKDTIEKIKRMLAIYSQ